MKKLLFCFIMSWIILSGIGLSEETPSTETTPIPEVVSEVAAPVPTEIPENNPPVKTKEVMPTAQVSHSENNISNQFNLYSKGFILKSVDEKYLMRINLRVQSRFAIEDGTLKKGGTETDSKKYNFSIPRERIKFEGNAFSKDLNYVLQVELGKGFVKLLDTMVDYGIIPEVLDIRTCQFKKPFSRQQMTSSGNLQFLDRAITDKHYNAGRDIGFSFSNELEKKKSFEITAGLFNGTGIETAVAGTVTGDVEVDAITNKPVFNNGKLSKSTISNIPDKFNPDFVARAAYNYGDINGYSEGDLEGGDLRFSVAGGFQAIFDLATDKNGKFIPEMDSIIKYKGFSFLNSFFLLTQQNKKGYLNQEYKDFGFHVQTGYLINKFIEPVIRVAMVLPDAKSDTEMGEYLAGFNFFLNKHNVKIQLESGALTEKTDTTEKTAFTGKAQFQLSF